MSTFVLVHGGFVGGWLWEKVVPLLEDAGHQVEAPDLPRHGDDRTPIPEVSLQGYADRISQVLDAQPEPVVLVGQSMGGMVISQAAEQRPDKIAMLVYVGAHLLRDGESLLSASEDDTESLVLSNLVMNEDGSSAIVREDAIREAIMADCSDEDLERAKSRFEPQAVAPLATPITLTEDNFGRIPRVYIETLKDRSISPSFQKEMYERLPCEKVVSMDTGHWPFYSAPEELASHLSSLPARDSVPG
ncbi:alpha/beta fold hydrolase [Rubrobacter aplysinae]|uniref:alpha/beta fold hydrolase n=1 Tax=Rubrobacter aplysinae TaxID=909625 RepID=UPI00064B8AE3|nr:alpha/beta fold hydrolase [Rubrobacter aplysinae]